MTKPDLDIIKSPEAARMLQMVTQGFYDRSYIGLWLFEVIGREYDGMAEWARTLRLEAFPQTCTWSIDIWDFVYGYEPDNTLPLSFRRQRILSKKLQRPPINPAHIEAVLSALTGCPVHITENVAPYTFKVEIDESGGQIVDYKAVDRTLREIKPSHLSVRQEVVIVVTFNTEDYSAGVIADCFTEFFIGDEIVIPTETADYTTGGIAEWTREFVSADETEIPTDTADLTGAGEALWLREVFTEIFPISETVSDYDGGAATEYVKEVFTE